MTKLIHLPLAVEVRIKLRPDKKHWARFVLTTNKKNSPNLCQHQKNLGVCVCVGGGLNVDTSESHLRAEA